MTCRETDECEFNENGERNETQDERDDEMNDEGSDEFDEEIDADFEQSEEYQQLSEKLDEIASFMDQLEERNEALKQQLHALLFDIKQERS